MVSGSEAGLEGQAGRRCALARAWELSVAGGRMASVGSRLRPLAGPFVVAPPSGARVRTRLRVTADEARLLGAVGAHLGSLAGADLARRCAEGSLDAAGRALSRRERKRALTAACSSRWAGAITRSSEDAWVLAGRNLAAEARSLRARIGRIRRRLAVPAGERRGRLRGYATRAERFEKQRRVQVLAARLRRVEARLAAGRVSVCRGGRRLARARHHLQDAGISEPQWREGWQAARWFLTADGEAAKPWGNETIRWHPGEGWLEIKLPAPLARLANRAHGRYRLSAPVGFPYRGREVAAQTASGAVRYDVSFDPDKSRWYLDASWTAPPVSAPELAELRSHHVLGVDLNADHLAAVAMDRSGNPLSKPDTIALRLAGLAAPARDGRLRAAISSLLSVAARRGCQAVVVEDLNFADARDLGRERAGRHQASGRRGRSLRRMTAGLPTGRFRDRLAGMAARRGLAVIAVDPAYTSIWGAQHWLGSLKEISSGASGHHAAAVVTGRRGLGQRARRRARRDSTRPEDRGERAADSAGWPELASAGLPGPRIREPGDPRARGQPPRRRRKTQPASRHPPGHQAAQDRSGPPAGQESLPSVSRNGS